jgi:hypothetical protein
MQSRIDSFFTRDVQAFNDRLSQIRQKIDPEAVPERDASYHNIRRAMQEMVEGCRRLDAAISHDADLLRETQRRFYDATAEWFDVSWIGHRSRTKPRGYPGDYLLLNTVYDEAPKSPGFSGYIDLYLLDMLLAQAVRARWQAVRSFLLEELSQRTGEVHVLNVASGPGREYVGGLPAPGVALQVTCIDNDQEALDFVEEKVRPQAPGMTIECQRYNALRMKSADATRRLFGASDIIYSIGLCDYLTDHALVGIMEGWRKSLAEDGVLLVAFKDGPRYDRIEYQWLLDWHFFQRTEEDCRRLFYEAGFDARDLEMTRDTTGVIMNFIARPKPSALRMDEPHAARATPHLAVDPLPGDSPSPSTLADAP